MKELQLEAAKAKAKAAAKELQLEAARVKVAAAAAAKAAVKPAVAKASSPKAAVDDDYSDDDDFAPESLSHSESFHSSFLDSDAGSRAADPKSVPSPAIGGGRSFGKNSAALTSIADDNASDGLDLDSGSLSSG
jgi:hypothetical protein